MSAPILNGHLLTSGIRWSALGQYTVQAVSLVSSVVLARLLDPRDFGLLAMALVFVSFTQALAQLGSGTLVVQRKQVSRQLLDSLFSVNLLAGILGAVALWILSPLVARLYRTGDVVPVLRALSAVLVLSSAGLIHGGLLRRRLDFRRLAWIEAAAVISKGACAISLAALGKGVWALVAGFATESLVRTGLLFTFSGWFPRLQIKRKEIMEAKDFLLNVTGFAIFRMVSRNADNLIIGRALGSVSLGYYSLAYTLYTLPNQYVSFVVARVLLPALSAVQDEKEELKRIYLRACEGISLITFPITIGLALTAGPFVLSVYGEKWSPAIPVVSVLAALASIQSIAVTTGHLLIALDKTGVYLRWGLFSGAVLIAAFLIGIRWGLMGITSAYALTMIPLSFGSFFISFRAAGIAFRELLHALRPYASATLAMAIAVGVVRSSTTGFGLAAIETLVISVLIGALAYGAMLYMSRPPAVYDLARMVGVDFPARPRLAEGR